MVAAILHEFELDDLHVLLLTAAAEAWDRCQQGARGPGGARGAQLDGPVLPNRHGDKQTPSNVERRLKTAIRRANRRLRQLGIEPISEVVTPHSLRRLYASLRFALGDDPVYVAQQLGRARFLDEGLR